MCLCTLLLDMFLRGLKKMFKFNSLIPCNSGTIAQCVRGENEVKNCDAVRGRWKWESKTSHCDPLRVVPNLRSCQPPLQSSKRNCLTSFEVSIVFCLCDTWSRDSLLVRARDSWLKGWEFESRQERRENFLLQNQFSVLTLIRCPFHPRVTAVARKRPRSFCQKCR